MNKYTFYWRTGQREVLEGDSPLEAVRRRGYGAGAMSAVDFYKEGDDHSYDWINSNWVRKPGLPWVEEVPVKPQPMTEEIVFNANYMVYVQLTSKGLDLIRSKDPSVPLLAPYSGYHRFILWQFMNLVGQELVHGSDLFNQNIILEKAGFRQPPR